MPADPLEELLWRADESAPRRAPRAPHLADLERRRRLQIARRAGALLVLAALVTSLLWIPSRRDGRRARLLSASAEDLTSSLAELSSALDGLQLEFEPSASSASEDAALVTFRAFHGGADRGDAQALEGMRWLAQRFPTTRGGRCAQLFLNDRGTDSPAARGDARAPSNR